MSRHSDLAELLGVSPRQLAKTNAIEQDRYDARLYRDLLNASRELQDLAGRGTATWPALLQDIWAAFYKAAPELVPEEQMDLAHRTNRPFAERLLEDKTTAETRLITMLDELSAGIATVEAGKRLLEEIQKRPELQQAMEQAEQTLQAQDQGDEEQAQVLLQQATQGLQQAARELRRAVRQAVEAGREKAQEVQQVLGGWGLEPADLQRVPLAERLKLVERLTSYDMKRLADLIGRFRNLAKTRQKEKLKKERDELHGITIGADLGRVLPAELAMLRHPLRRLDFYRRFTEKQLLQYELRTREPQGRGPMIVLVDASGSMYGHKMDWASAVALALVDTAIRQKRRAAVIHFNTQIIQEVEFELGKKELEKFISVATVGSSGGTDYTPPLLRAVELILNVGYEKADICMITDGECKLDHEILKEFLEVKKRHNFRCWSVLIGARTSQELQKWSDRVWAIPNLSDEVAGELFEAVY
ncbi:MAG: VWA domain-containing protein [Moorellaceae bacterium]